MAMIAARAWMKDGKIVIDTPDVQYKVDVSLMDFIAIKAGNVADVEIKVIDKKSVPPPSPVAPDPAA